MCAYVCVYVSMCVCACVCICVLVSEYVYMSKEKRRIGKCERDEKNNYVRGEERYKECACVCVHVCVSE